MLRGRGRGLYLFSLRDFQGKCLVFNFLQILKTFGFQTSNRKKNKNNKITYKFKCIPKSLEPFGYKNIKYNTESKQ